jgi:hypothetical protein
MAATAASSRQLPSRILVIMCEDVFAVVDDGRAPLSDYAVVREMVAEQHARYPAGLGCLAIIPPNAKPPSEEVRKTLNATLESVPLKCICWYVEGSGFQAGMVRAVLTGLRFFTNRTYATHVAADLEASIRWIFGELDRTSPRQRSVSAALARIREQRQSGPLEAAASR